MPQVTIKRANYKILFKEVKMDRLRMEIVLVFVVCLLCGACMFSEDKPQAQTSEEKITYEDLRVYIHLGAHFFRIKIKDNIKDEDKENLLKELKSSAKNVESICKKLLSEIYLEMIDSNLKNDIKDEKKKEELLTKIFKVNCETEYLLETDIPIIDDKIVDKRSEWMAEILKKEIVKNNVEKISYAFIPKPAAKEYIEKKNELKGIFIWWLHTIGFPNIKKMEKLSSILTTKYGLISVKNQGSFSTYKLSKNVTNPKQQLINIVENIMGDDVLAINITTIGLDIKYNTPLDCEDLRRKAESAKERLKVIEPEDNQTFQKDKR